MKRILVFSFSFIGDAVLSTAVIQPLRSHFKDVHLTYLVGPRAIDILKTDAQIDATVVYDNRGVHAGLKGRLKLIKTLRQERFDLVVNLRDSLLARCIGADHWGLVRGDRNRHAVVRYLEVLSRNGVDTTDAKPNLQLSEEEKTDARRFLEESEITSKQLLMGIHPGGNWEYKLWDAEKFAQLADTLNASDAISVLLFAGPNERNLQSQISGLMKTSPVIIDTLNLREVAGLISACDVYLCNDTGPMHIAAALGTPVVALFGSTNHIRSGPYGEGHVVVRSELDLGCNPCHPGRNPGGCGAGSCAVINGISVEQALEEVTCLLAVSPGR